MASVVMRRGEATRALGATRNEDQFQKPPVKPKTRPRLYLLNAAQSGERPEKEKEKKEKRPEKRRLPIVGPNYSLLGSKGTRVPKYLCRDRNGEWRLKVLL